MEFPVRELSPELYPPALREIPRCPKKLFLRGADFDGTKRTVSFVGARRHSDYGMKACETIISRLAGKPIVIISGLALGIDAIAHRSALRAGLTTVAVVGSGLDESVLYPATNRNLGREILESGGTLVSELPPMTRAAKHTFPSRNRIMAGLSELVIAVECAELSGTRITMRLATEYNREVGAVPHGIFSEVGAGTNALIRQGAHVIRSADDVLELLNMESGGDAADSAADTLETLTGNERTVYDALSSPKTKTVLSQETGLPAHTLQATLALLEMKQLTTETLGTVQRM